MKVVICDMFKLGERRNGIWTAVRCNGHHFLSAVMLLFISRNNHFEKIIFKLVKDGFFFFLTVQNIFLMSKIKEEKHQRT